jgi:hypothetical protein
MRSSQKIMVSENCTTFFCEILTSCTQTTKKVLVLAKKNYETLERLPTHNLAEIQQPLALYISFGNTRRFP